MANELPYFRFIVQAWQNGKIDMENYELKGFFISVCGFYWIQDCNITLSILKKKFPRDENLIKKLLDLTIIKHENRHDKIKIDFLLTQQRLLCEKRNTNKTNGLKGSQAKARLNQNVSYKDKDKDKDKDNSQKSELNYDFIDDKFKPAFREWVKYKNETKKPFKIQMVIEAAYNELRQLSNNKPLEAIKIVQFSIGMNYQSLCARNKDLKIKTVQTPLQIII